jgi:FkbM family methyltransferase
LNNADVEDEADTGMRMKFDQFRFSEPALSLIVNRQKISLFRWLTRKVPPLFLCGGDVMTTGPMVTGYHEPDVLSVLAFLARSGFDQALIDVGANVGLMTYHCRSLFRSFHCFEPNPRVFNVLTANLAGVFGRELHLHNFGLGEQDETSVLFVPHRNQGGAFIAGNSNAYSEDVLSDAKRVLDGMSQINVEVRRGRRVFQELFAEMPDGGFVVKIDTEGFERTILREIVAAKPTNARIAVAFENLQPEFDAPTFMRNDMRTTGLALKLADNLDATRSRIDKELAKLTRGKEFRLTDQPSDWVGTVVLVLEKASL